MAPKQEDNWSSEAYQNSASFVPKLAGKVIGWLNVQEDDVILDLGCGDGVINIQLAQTLSKGKGRIHGVDASEAMIATAKKAAASDPVAKTTCTFEVLNATKLSPDLQKGTFDRVFSNAAMHWILRPEETRKEFFLGVRNALKPGGVFAFEMGGMGNVSESLVIPYFDAERLNLDVEVRTAFLSVIGRKLGYEKAREIDPWFFPDEVWMTKMMEETVGGFKIEKIEREYRPTKADEGGIEGWVRLMGKQFFDGIVDRQEREECVKEICEMLKTVCESPGGGDWFGYVRLRVLARKV